MVEPYDSNKKIVITVQRCTESRTNTNEFLKRTTHNDSITIWRTEYRDRRGTVAAEGRAKERGREENQEWK